MIPVLTAEDVRRQDAEAVARGIPVEQLMENAGRAVAGAARRMMGGTYGRRVVVVCGKGNNGGDGLVAACALAERGAAVGVVLVFPKQELVELASLQLSRFRGRVFGPDVLQRELARADLVIDAIFGVGLTRAPSDEIRRAFIAMSTARVLAVDVPSGIDADTGAIDGGAVRAQATVTFGGYKPGLMFEPGREFAGIVEIADIGTRSVSTANAIDRPDLTLLWPLRGPQEHKRSAGTVLVVAGSRAMPGAAALVAGASVHAGSGLTVLCAPEDVCRVVVARVPEITTIPVLESSEGTIDEKALDLIRPRFGEFHSIAVGPGLTTHPGTADFVRALVAEAPMPIVLDADGLNAFAGDPSGLTTRSPNTTVLTPHSGELSRLTGAARAELEADRMRSAQRFARELGSVLVFKGPGTVTSAFVSHGENEHDLTFINPTGGSALAQGGTGDALTGLIASVVAQMVGGLDVENHVGQVITSRVAAAVWLHGFCADRIARRLAPHPANASALIDEIGPALHEVFAS